jgi:hypothetical protein
LANLICCLLKDKQLWLKSLWAILKYGKLLSWQLKFFGAQQPRRH